MELRSHLIRSYFQLRIIISSLNIASIALKTNKANMVNVM